MGMRAQGLGTLRAGQWLKNAGDRLKGGGDLSERMVRATGSMRTRALLYRNHYII